MNIGTSSSFYLLLKVSYFQDYPFLSRCDCKSHAKFILFLFYYYQNIMINLYLLDIFIDKTFVSKRFLFIIAVFNFALLNSLSNLEHSSSPCFVMEVLFLLKALLDVYFLIIFIFISPDNTQYSS